MEILNDGLAVGIDGSKQKDGAVLKDTIVCFSHLRWDFVFQRPQHLLTRLGKTFNIIFIEEPVFEPTGYPYYSYATRGDHVTVMTPHLVAGLAENEVSKALTTIFGKFMQNRNPAKHLFWYYSPMALEFSRMFLPDVVIYDCMDELSAFKNAPRSLKALEAELLNVADVVFTGGFSLYEAKKQHHVNIHPLPSSIETGHFKQVRSAKYQSGPDITLGFYGVIDERFDIGLIKDIADKMPGWTITLIGPVVKIDPHTLPRNNNIRYMGMKSYADLPKLMMQWDVALIPFLLNDSTKFISPTKTPEYLAAGIPVISTAIEDVINPYGKNGLVQIAADADEFIHAAQSVLATSKPDRDKWLTCVDTFLAQNSWDKTTQQIIRHITDVQNNKSFSSIAQS